MTHFIAYDELTWPEVADLATGYFSRYPSWRRLSTGLARFIALQSRPNLSSPPASFWLARKSPACPQSVLFTMMSNLLDSLRDDGFTRHLYSDTSRNSYLDLGANQISLPVDTPQGMGEVFGEARHPRSEEEQGGFYPHRAYRAARAPLAALDRYAHHRCHRAGRRGFRTRPGCQAPGDALWREHASCFVCGNLELRRACF